MLRAASAAFDRIESFWGAARVRRALTAVLVVAFLGTIACVEAMQRGWLPAPVRLRVPHGHFFAVEVALYLLLGWEVIGLVLGLAQSVANAAGKQFEIFSLILLRHSFEEFARFGEPLVWDEVKDSVLRMLSNGFGALLIFVVLGFYYAAQRHLPITGDARERESFIRAKKVVALALLGVFAFLGARAALRGGEGFFDRHFFLNSASRASRGFSSRAGASPKRAPS